MFDNDDAGRLTWAALARVHLSYATYADFLFNAYHEKPFSRLTFLICMTMKSYVDARQSRRQVQSAGHRAPQVTSHRIPSLRANRKEANLSVIQANLSIIQAD